MKYKKNPPTLKSVEIGKQRDKHNNNEQKARQNEVFIIKIRLLEWKIFHFQLMYAKYLL